MAQMTKDDIKKLVKDAVREVFNESSIVKDMISECIKTSVLTILQEVKTTSVEETIRPVNESNFFQETPLQTPASKTKINSKKEPIIDKSQIFNRDNMTKMFEEEFGISTNSSSKVPTGQSYLADMNDTLEDDPRVLKALGISL